MAHQIAPSVNCSLDEIDLNALKVNILFIYDISAKKGFIVWDRCVDSTSATILPTLCISIIQWRIFLYCRGVVKYAKMFIAYNIITAM